MSNKTVSVNDSLYSYLLAHSLQEPAVLRQLRQETQTHPQAVMQISPDQGQFMRLLVHLINARKTLEIGVFTGYSTLSVALALPADGQIIACDISADYTAIAQRYWQAAGVADKIDLRIAPALDTLDQLIDSGQTASFDFAFIDADKGNYGHYYDRALQLIRPGGLIAIDNVFWSGRVADPEDQDKITNTLRAFNTKLMNDDRVLLSMVPIADGLTLAFKRP